MNICLYSIFRDNGAGSYIADYFARIADLDVGDHDIRVVVAEGDSEDDTHYQLLTHADPVKYPNYTVLQHNTGQSKEIHQIISHTVPERLDAMSQMYNVCIDEMVRQDWADICWLIESDIPYPSGFLLRLLKDMPEDAGCVAPMIWIVGKETGCIFYDLWGYRFLDGTHFPPYSPAWYNAKLGKWDNHVEVSAACAGFLTKMGYLRDGARCTPDDEAAGMQTQIREMGGRIYVNTSVNLFHPLEEFHNI